MKKIYFAVLIAAVGSSLVAQNLTLSSTGQTGTSGTGWSTSGTNPLVINVTDAANINVSVINAALATVSVVINGPAEDIVLANSIEKAASNSTTTLTIKSNRDFIMNSGASINGATGGALNTVIWVDADGNTSGGVALRSVDTKGGHLYIGGGSASTTWNSLTVPNDGAQDPHFVYTYGTTTVVTANSPITWYANNSLVTGGGHVVLWADDKGDLKFLSHGTNEVNAGTGDITLKAQAPTRHSGNPVMRTTGNFAFLPGGSGVNFSFNRFFGIFSFPLTLTSFTWGLPGNYEYVDVSNTVSVTGDVTICSRDIQWYVQWTTPNGSFYIYTHNQVDPIGNVSMVAPNGSINIIPADGLFNGTQNIPVSNLTWSAPVVNFGNSSTGTDVSFINTASIAAGQWNVWANNATFDGSHTYTTAGAGLTLRAKGSIAVNANRSVATNGGPIQLISDSDNDGSGALTVASTGVLDTRTASDRTAATYTTGGGKLTLNSGSASMTLGGVLNLTGGVELRGGNITLSNNLSTTGDIAVHSTSLAVNGNITTTSGGDLALNSTSTTVASGKYLNVSGDVTNNGALLLSAENSSDGAYAQLKFGGTWNPLSTGSVTVQQYVEDGRHLIASPFTSSTASVFSGTGPNAGTIGKDANNLYNLFGWSGQDWEPIESGTSALVPGKGYIANVGTFTANGTSFSNGVRTAPGVIGFTGTTPIQALNLSMSDLTANSAVSVDNSGSLGKRGWNLVANPFTCAMSSTAFTSANNMKGAVYRWNPKLNGNAGQYQSHSPAGNNTDDAIAPLQAFWVQTNNAAANVTLNMASHGTVSQAPVFRKTGEFEADRLRFHVARTSNGSYQDEAFVAMAEGTVDGFDDAWDAHELNSGNDAVYLYSYIPGDASMANNAIPYGKDVLGDKTLPMAFRAPGDGEAYTLELDPSLSENTYDVLVEDHRSGTVHNLSESPYTFANDTQMPQRFTVRFRSEKTKAFNAMGTSGLNVWSRNGQLVLWMDQLGVGNFTLIGMDGREIPQGALRLDGTRTQEVPLPATVTPGVYFVRARYNNGNTVFTRVVP